MFKFLKVSILVSILFFAVGGCFVFADNVSEQKAKLEAELADLERQIEDQVEIIKEKQREATTFERDITILNAQISKARLGIQARNIAINNLTSGIVDCSGLIDELEEEMAVKKVSLAELLRKVDEMDATSVVEIVLGYDSLSEFFEEFNSLESVQKELQFSLDDIKNTQNKTAEEKNILENQKTEEVELKYIQELAKNELEKKEDEKRELLRITEGEEAKYQKVLKEKQASAADIRSRIFRLFGGGELHFEEALDIASFAEQATGIRAAFILAVLAQESAMDGVIGRNLGQCFYNTPANNSSGTVMSSSQIPAFLAIMSEIGMNPSITPVSCPIVSDGSHGGAMGPAQFMPRTWWDSSSGTGYKKRIAKVTGHNPPSPFDNSDAFVGTALYLKDAYNSSACVSYAEENQHISPKQLLQERCAAAKYYAGGAWYKFRWAYGEPVVERADKFQKDIDIISQ
ncbi:MAG: lytic murein transglycosylase [Candidatus Marinimicrobia bacterium]|nr:lytic murein transglycosylase [Candidatus Neomarinimicrobiota bacterium]